MADFNPPGERRSAAGLQAGQPGPVQPQPTHSAPAGDGQPNGASPDHSLRSPPQVSPRHPARQAYAAIDLGTNNCRLLIARPSDANFVVIDAFSRVVMDRTWHYLLIESGAPVPRIVDWHSVPWGVVSLTETVGGIATGAGEGDEAARLARYGEMRRLVAESFAEFADRVVPRREPHLRLLGTSGTVTTLASLHLDLPHYDRKAVDGLIVPSSSMRDIAKRLSGMSPEDRRQLPCIGNERADLVVAGCAILEGILDIWPAERLGVADRGIREGILRGLMAADAEGFAAQAALRRLKQSGE